MSDTGKTVFSALPMKRLPREEQPRSRLLGSGPVHLSSVELLSILIECGQPGKNAFRIAEDMLGLYGSLRELARVSAQELLLQVGIGPATACRILAAFELGRRCLAERLRKGAPIRCCQDVYEEFHLRLRDLKQETFWSILLDGQHKLVRSVRVSVGSLTTSVVHPREVFNPAVRESASAIILLHNHPSGDPSPSQMDWDVTHRLVKAGELLGIKVLDHVIIGDDRYVSLKEESALFD